MQLLLKRDKHIKQEEKDYGYGSICSRCNSVFIFDRKDACIPRCINPQPKDCTIICPNCQNVTHLDKCRKFKTLSELEDFKSKYDN